MSSFERWEKDPFFAAAEEVQNSSDRMESAFRSWIQERNNGASAITGPNSDFGLLDLPRELQTALGTAKWQLEELERAVKSNDDAYSSGEDTRTRHSQFISAIESRINMIENSLKELNIQKGEKQHSWVRLDQEERDELALFLYCPSKTQKSNPKDTVIDISKDSSESTSSENKHLKNNKHRRGVSADADIGSWKINIPSEGEDTSERSSEEREKTNLPFPKVLSSSGLKSTLEMKSRVKLHKKGARKGHICHRQDLEASIPLNSVQLNQGIEEGCYERRGCLSSSCGDNSCEKEISGWIGAFQRQIQRSQYQIQYGRPIQIVIIALFVLLLIFMFVWSTSS